MKRVTLIGGILLATSAMGAAANGAVPRVEAVRSGKPHAISPTVNQVRVHSVAPGRKTGVTNVHPLGGRRTQFSLPAAPAPKAGAATTVTTGRLPLYGVVGYADGWSDYSKAGVYRVPVKATEEFVSVATGTEFAGENAMMTPQGMWLKYTEERIFGTFQFGTLFDPATWTKGEETPITREYDARSVAWDAVNSVAYCSSKTPSGTTYTLSTLNVATSALTPVASTGSVAFTSMASSGGILYATTSEGKFVKVNTQNGTTVTVGENIPVSTYNTAAIIDSEAGCYYYAYAATTGSAMYAISITDGAVQKLYDMPANQNIIGLWLGEAEAQEGAPSAPANLAAIFASNSLTGTVEFDMPATTYGGAPLSGSLNYTVKINGATAASGTAAAGAHVSAPVTVASSGDYRIEVTASNTQGSSPAAMIERHIGAADLRPIAAPQLTIDGNTLTLNWAAPATVDNTAPEAGSVTYTVTRYPGEVRVAGGITATTFSEQAPQVNDLTLCYYTVTVNYNGNAQTPVASNNVKLGHAQLPYSENFATAASADFYTIIDANGDGATWLWTNGLMHCDYREATGKDDWLILPPMQLEKGFSYRISFDTWATGDTYPEEFAVYAGSKPEASALTQCLVSPTVIPTGGLVDGMETTVGITEQPMHVSADFVPAASGIYYIGVKASSAPFMYYLNVDNVKVDAGLNTAAPSAATNFTAEAANDCSPRVTLRFTLPSKAISGAALSRLTKVDIYCGDNKVATLTSDLTPGAMRTYTHENAPMGAATYRIVPWLDNMEGTPAEATCFVGAAAPLPVASAKVVRGSDTGEAKISWEPVDADINGKSLADGRVTYDVYRLDDEARIVVASGITDTQVTDRVCDANAAQKFIYYEVKPYSASASAEATETDQIPVGKPYGLPYVESVAGGHLSNLWTMDVPLYNGTFWEVSDDEYVEGITSLDHDNGFFVLHSEDMNFESTLVSANIAIPANTPAPGLSYYVYDYASGNTLELLVNDGNGFTPVSEITCDGLPEGWSRKSVSLEAYKGKTIQIAFRGRIVDSNLIALDCIRLESQATNDLIARGISAPARVQPGKSYKVKVTVENAGNAPADGYMVVLTENGEYAATMPGKALAASATTEVEIERTADLFSPETIEYAATIEYNADSNTANNAVAGAVTAVELPLLPAPAALTGSADGNTVSLSWTAADVASARPAAVTDDVEDYIAGSIGLEGSEVADDNMGQWQVIDGDHTETYQIINAPEYANATRAKSFMVLSLGEMGIAGARSGAKVFASFSCYDSTQDRAVPADDWLISPELYGGEQTVTFYATSMNGNFPESMEMYYSLGGTAREDFVKAGAVAKVPSQWTAYTIELPAGAKHFAIRCNSNDAFALLIDDITYIPADAQLADLELLGYNIYRDKVKINSAPVAATSYTDTAEEGHRYHVTAVYNNGESRSTNAWDNGTIALTPAGDDATVTVLTAPGAIIVKAPASTEVTVHTASGQAVYRGKPGRVAAGSGIYVVAAGTTVKKVLVK